VADLIVSLSHVATSLKGAWLLWIVWSVVQVGWYRRGRFAIAHAAPVSGTSASWPRRPALWPKATEKAPSVEPPVPEPPSSESAKTVDGGFISLGLDERQLPDIELPV